MQLAFTTSTLSTLSNTVEGMESHLVCTQQAILFQSQELSLTCAMTDLRSNTMSLRVNLVLETDETKKQEISALLISLMNDEEQRLNDELAKTNHDFHAVINGPSVDQLLSGDTPLLSNPANEDEHEGIKRWRLNSSNVPHETNDAPSQTL